MPTASIAPFVAAYQGRMRNLPGPAAGPSAGSPAVPTALYDDTQGRVTLAVTNVPAGTVTVHYERSTNGVAYSDVRGGQVIVPVSGAVSLYDYEYSAGVLNYYRASFISAVGSIISRAVVTVTPVQTGVWLKNPLRPFLNSRVTVVGFSDITRASRARSFDVIGRTNPVAVTDLMSGRTTTYTIRTTSAQGADALDNTIAVGEILFIQPPYQAAPPTMYGVPGGVTRSQVAATSAVRLFAVPMTEVAQPDPSLAAVQSNWQTVVSTYATWNDLLAAKATWNDVLQIVGSVSDIITS